MQTPEHPLLRVNQKAGTYTVAIEPSRQFRNPGKGDLSQKLKAAKIDNLETEAAKNRQIIQKSIQQMYGSVPSSRKT